MNEQLTLHYIQSELIKKLALTITLGFNELIIDGLESEHMNYHLKKLISLNLVEKIGNKYTLTDGGKDYANLLDDNIQIIEKQPKSSVILHVVRKNETTDEIEHLVCKRLKQPYFGKVGRLTGKIKFGETFKQAAERELYEETGLIAKSYTLEKIYHKLRYRENNEFIQDVIFYIFFIKEIEGKLINKLPYQENFWISSSEIKTRKDLDLYDGFEVDDRFEPKILEIVENVGEAKGF